LMSVQNAQAGLQSEAKPPEKQRAGKPRKWGEPLPAPQG
jgi:hypothetical protein